MILATGDPHAPALVLPGGGEITYQQLDSLSREWTRQLDPAPGKHLVVVVATPTLPAVVAYLAVIRAGHAVLLVDPHLSVRAMRRIAAAFEPELIVGEWDELLPGYRPAAPTIQRRTVLSGQAIHEQATVLMMTSGSTGAPKVVVLSQRNLLSNAASICAALGIEAPDRAITCLPLHYCFGLSILNSHLSAGASVVLAAEAPASTRFWRRFTETGATSFSGVPLTFEALRRTLLTRWPPALRSLAQAGGPLAEPTTRAYADAARRHGARFFVMYGQTEATARMSVLDATAAPERIGSVGRAIPGGRLWTDDTGEVLYAGPNVMLGYAETRADLGLGDRLHGVLRTGDLGAIDSDAYLTLRGRRKRIAKIAGRRINLDEWEQALGDGLGPLAVVAAEPDIVVYCTEDSTPPVDRISLVCQQNRLPTSAVRTRIVPEIPVTATNKIDYDRLGALR